MCEHRQDHCRGDAGHPLSDAALQQKFLANCAFGGLKDARAQALLVSLRGVFDLPRTDGGRLISGQEARR
ncbi:MAG: MmgE/PrpD family protein [Polaromonas sp.]|nr:MmgE/PrpD family protein [Polaromonas sp.]